LIDQRRGLGPLLQDGWIGGVAVDFFRIEYLFGFRPFQVYVAFGLFAFEICADRNPAVEAATVADVAACAAGNVYAEPDAILIIVDQ